MESSYILIITLLIFGVREIFCSPEPGLKRSEIVGGKKTAPGSIKYIVSLQRRGVHDCGGSIIKPNIIITAAHCTYGVWPRESLSVRAGSSQHNLNGQLVRVISVVEHPNFVMRKTYLNYDVALLKLEQPLNYNSYVHSIALIENQNFVSESMPLGLISGWGRTREGGETSFTLRHAQVRILKKATCERYVQSRYHITGENILCAGYRDGYIDACQGDSGGPLVVGRKLVGITSFGNGCARPNEPGYYTNIAQLRPWIDQNIQYLEQQQNNFYHNDYFYG